jgi:hypothetical protein
MQTTKDRAVMCTQRWYLCLASLCSCIFHCCDSLHTVYSSYVYAALVSLSCVTLLKQAENKMFLVTKNNK